MQPTTEPLFSPVMLQAGIFVLTLVSYAFAIARWVLSRERAHVEDDAEAHKLVDANIEKIREKTEHNSGEITAITARVASLPTREVLDNMFHRFEDQTLSQLRDLETRLTERVDKAEKAHEARSTIIVDKLGEVLENMERRSKGRDDPC